METYFSSFRYNDTTYYPYNKLPTSESAVSLTGLSKKTFILIAAVILLFFIINWHVSLLFAVTILTTLYFIDVIFNLFIIIKSFLSKKTRTSSTIQAVQQEEAIYPPYTIFCPLYKETAVVPQFISAIGEIDYPKDKLQVLLLLEEDDKETIDALRHMRLPENFFIIIVPDSLPKTKPKACNYGLQFATGKYCVIYDAEDKPESDQLKKVVNLFKTLPDTVACIQAKLNFYNPEQNLLTRLFTTEYTTWFELTLFGLEALNAPIPLGGTSNHFRTNILRKVQGWDAFNVTEDADLGIRLVENGYQTALINSTTFEEANSKVKNWFSQRSRWIKGYMQTYLVHLKNMFSAEEKKNAFYFQLFIGGKVLSLFINPLMWFICLSYFLFRPVIGSFIESFYPAPVLYMAVICIVFGNFIYFYDSMIALAKHRSYHLIWVAFFMPFYYLMMSIAGWMALYSLIRKPFYWAKTKHGYHMTSHPSMSYSQALEPIKNYV